MEREDFNSLLKGWEILAYGTGKLSKITGVFRFSQFLFHSFYA